MNQFIMQTSKDIGISINSDFLVQDTADYVIQMCIRDRDVSSQRIYRKAVLPNNQKVIKAKTIYGNIDISENVHRA